MSYGGRGTSFALRASEDKTEGHEEENGLERKDAEVAEGTLNVRPPARMIGI